MRKNLKTIALLLCVLLLTVASSCKTSKPAYRGDVQALDASSEPVEALFDALASSYKPWTDLYVPVTLSLESPKRMAVSGRATMVYGKQIYISLRLLGMEVGSLYIDESRIYVVDKFHKQYFCEDISTLLSGVDASITDVQDMLLGRAILPGKGVVTPGDVRRFTYLETDQQWILTPTEQIPGAEWHYIASKTDPPLLTAVLLRLTDGLAVGCQLAEPTATPAGIVDGVATVTIPYKDDEIAVSLTWQLSDAKWDTGREVSFSVPASYRRLGMDAIIKALDNL